MTEELLAQAQTALSGMKAISLFCRSINLASSESSIINMIQTCDFPARKIGGIWESDKAMIIGWRRRFIGGELGEKSKDEPVSSKTDGKKLKRKKTSTKPRRW